MHQDEYTLECASCHKEFPEWEMTRHFEDNHFYRPVCQPCAMDYVLAEKLYA